MTILEQVAARLNSIGIYALTAILIGLLILVHELGHFFAALWAKMRVEELSLGVGRKLTGTVRNGIEYSLRAVPFLGYVKITGMGLFEEEDAPDGFDSRPWGARFATLAAGGVANILFAALIFCVALMWFGAATDSTSDIEQVSRGKPAEAAGFLRHDRIVSVGEVETTDVETIRDEIEKQPGKALVITVERAGQRVPLNVTPASEDLYIQQEDGTIEKKKVGRIGIAFHPVYESLGVWEAMKAGVARTAYECVHVVLSLWLTIRGQLGVQVVGPVGIVNELGSEAQAGAHALPQVVDLWGRISVMLGMLNLAIPFPGLDGCRLLFLCVTPVVEFLRRRKVDRRFEVWVHAAGVGVLLLFLTFVTIKDVVNWH